MCVCVCVYTEERERRYKLGRSLVVMRLGKLKEGRGPNQWWRCMLFTRRFFFLSLFHWFLLLLLFPVNSTHAWKIKKKRKFPIAAASNERTKSPLLRFIRRSIAPYIFVCPKRTEWGAKRGVDWKTVTRANQHTPGHEKEEERWRRKQHRRRRRRRRDDNEDRPHNLDR